MRELGLFGLSIAPEHGGLGLNMEEEVRVVFELGQTSPVPLAGRHQHRHRLAGHRAGRHRRAARALPAQAGQRRADRLRADEGTPACHGAARLGRARATTTCSTAPSDHQPSPAFKHAHPISCFLVEAGTPGLSIGRPDKKMGQSGALTSDVVTAARARQRAAGRRGRQWVPHLHAGAGQGPTAHLRAVRGHCRPSVARRGEVRHRPQAVRPAHRGIPADPGHDRRQPGRAVRARAAWC